MPYAYLLINCNRILLHGVREHSLSLLAGNISTICSLVYVRVHNNMSCKPHHSQSLHLMRNHMPPGLSVLLKVACINALKILDIRYRKFLRQN